MPRYLAILFALPLLLSCNESHEAKQLAPKKAEKHEQKRTKKAETELEIKLETEYEKRFGASISDFELSIAKVEYSYPNRYATMSITKTATGTIAKYSETELELDMDEWLDFINALHKCNIRGKKFSDAERTENYDPTGIFTPNPIFEGFRELNVQLSPLEELQFDFDPERQRYEDWADVAKIMDTMVENIIKKIAADIEPKLEAEYEKKFGIPISAFERSIRGVSFKYRNNTEHGPIFSISAKRTATGAYIEYIDEVKKHRDKMPDSELNLNFDVGEWLDFLNALNKFNVSKWKKEYINEDIVSEKFTSWQLHISFLEKDSSLTTSFSRRGVRSRSPKWNEFMKVMTDLEAKIKSKAAEK